MARYVSLAIACAALIAISVMTLTVGPGDIFIQ